MSSQSQFRFLRIVLSCGKINRRLELSLRLRRRRVDQVFIDPVGNCPSAPEAAR